MERGGGVKGRVPTLGLLFIKERQGLQVLGGASISSCTGM